MVLVALLPFLSVAALLGYRIARTAGALVSCALMTICWNAVKVGLPLSDAFLLLSLPAVVLQLVLRRDEIRVPVLCMLGAGLIALITLLDAAAPIDDAFERQRYQGLEQYLPTSRARQVVDVTNGIKYVLALVALPLCILAVARSRAHLNRLIDIWIVSAIVSSAVAILDNLSVTHISVGLLGSVDASGRQAGLANHPNHLAMASVQALPFVLARLIEGRHRVWNGVGVAVLLVGVFLSGSRGGLLVAAAVLVVMSALQPQARRVLVAVTPSLGFFVAAVVVARPSLASGLLEATRLRSTSGRDADEQRLLALAQAYRDFRHRPVTGIGFQVADQGHSVYLQILATAGLIGLAALALYFLGLWRLARRAGMLRDPLVLPAVVGVGVFLVLGAVENDLIDRYAYVPMALLLAFGVMAGPSRDPTVDGSARRLAQLPGAA